MSGRVQFVCDGSAGRGGSPHAAASRCSRCCASGSASMSVKDGCAPQGQCGCCTVLVDGEARVACVTPVGADRRPRGDHASTGSPAAERDARRGAFVATGGSQCGFCTPGIIVRARRARRRRAARRRPGVDRALAAHLCRCTGWRTVVDAIAATWSPGRAARVPRIGSMPRRRGAPSSRAACAQRVGGDVALGHGGFADDTAPRDALVAVPLPPGSDAPTRRGRRPRSWVIAESLFEARELARQGAGPPHDGRRRAAASRSPPLPDGGVRLATSWVEPAYLEPDASWCVPGGEPASPLANGGAFGGKATSPVAGRGARARRPPRSHGAGAVLPRGRRAARSEAAADRRRARCCATGRCTSKGVLRGECAHDDLAPPHYLGLDHAPTSCGPAVAGPPRRAAARAAGFAELRVLAGRRARRRRLRPRRAPADDARRGGVPRQRRGASRTTGVARRRARRHRRRRPARSSGSRSASRPAIRSTTSCCARTRSAPRTWRSAGC